MQKPTTRAALAVLWPALVMAVVGRPAEPALRPPEWPGWGGPAGNFIVEAPPLATTWPDEGPKRLWQRRLGEGHSSIVVDGDRLFTMYRPAQTTNPVEEEVVIALDRDTGGTVWEHRYPSSLAGMRPRITGVGPHTTPYVVGARLFVTGTNRQLMALDRESGRVLWQHDLVREYDVPARPAKAPFDPGYSGSPLPFKESVIVTGAGPGQAVMAFRQDTGTLIWRSGNFGASLSTPTLITLGGRPQLLVFHGDGVTALDPDSGSELWSHPHATAMGANITSPVFSAADQLLFLSSAYDAGSRLLELSIDSGKVQVRERWFTNRMRVQFGTVIRLGGHYYGSSGDGPAVMAAVDARTGAVAWQDRSFSRCSFVFADGKLVILDEDGTLGLAEVSSQGMKVLAKAAVLDRMSWTPPTLAGGTLYVRDRASIMALDLSAP